MTLEQVILGYLISTAVGALVLWLLIEVWGWGFLVKHGAPAKGRAILTVPMGIVERVLFTTAFLINAPSIVGFWVALKVAVKWTQWTDGGDRGTYNLFLIGTGLSILISYVGASVAAGQFIVY